MGWFLKYDLIVIGAGSGGVRAARMAAQAGKNVAIIEYQALGGTCVNVGCVPKKLFVYASHFAEAFDDAKGFGWQLDSVPEFSWKKLIENKNKEIEHLNSIYGNLLKKAGVTLITGKAKLEGANAVRVNGEIIEAEKILIATGSKPFVPDFLGSEYVSTSDAMFYLKNLPKKLLIVGGGFIAVEFAGIMTSLGVDTTLAYRGELFLRGFDRDIRNFLHQEMLKKGVKIQFNQNVTAITKSADTFQVQFTDGNSDSFDKILYATGRIPNTQDLALENAGVLMEKGGAIKVNANFQSSVPSIYALGDVIDKVQLTPVAIKEAMVLVNQLYGDKTLTMNYENIPAAVFSQPGLACVGLTEEQAMALAKEKGFELTIYDSDFEPMKFSLSENTERTFMKLIVNKDNDKILGAHMVGDSSAEIIQGLAIAINMGATKKDFDATVGIHPSSAEEFVTMRTGRQ